MVAALIERGIDGREGVIWGVHRCSLSMLPILFSSIHHISEWVHYCGQPNCNFSKNESVNQSLLSVVWIELPSFDGGQIKGIECV